MDSLAAKGALFDLGTGDASWKGQVLGDKGMGG